MKDKPYDGGAALAKAEAPKLKFTGRKRHNEKISKVVFGRLKFL